MTIISWPSPYGHTIFCDDIRREVDGKTTYVGVYNADMIFSTPPPVILAKLALAITYHEKAGEGSGPVEIRVFFPGDPEDKPRVKAALSPEYRNLIQAPDDNEQTNAHITFTAYINLSPVDFTEQGIIRVRAYRGDDEIRLGSLRVKFPAEPDASAPSNKSA